MCLLSRKFPSFSILSFVFRVHFIMAFNERVSMNHELGNVIGRVGRAETSREPEQRNENSRAKPTSLNFRSPSSSWLAEAMSYRHQGGGGEGGKLLSTAYD